MEDTRKEGNITSLGEIDEKLTVINRLLEGTTIDKTPLKVNLGIIGTIIVATSVVVGMYYQIQTKLTEINYQLVSLSEKIQTGETQHREMTDRINVLERKVLYK